MSTTDPLSEPTLELSTLPTNRPPWRLITAGGLCALLAAGAGVAAARGGRLPDPARIAPGVFVADVAVGGLTRDDALEKARGWARERLQTTVTLVGKERRFQYDLASLGGRFETQAAVEKAWAVGKDDNFLERFFYGDRERGVHIAPEFKADEAQIDRQLIQLAHKIDRAARNAAVKMDAKGRLVVSRPDEKGVRLDTAATRANLLRGGVDALQTGVTADLVVVEESPKITAAALGKLSLLLGAYSTNYSSSTGNRKANVALAASKINGTLLAPGDVFSYNGTVGPRDARLGWKMAHQYQDGLVVDGIGGGVCQVSSTLYNAVLLSGLKVVRRSNHSMPVAYLTAGRDATVSYDSVDFQFANSTGGPVYVAARTDGDRLLFRIYGAEPTERKVVDLFTSGRSYTRSGGFTVSSFRRVKDPDGTVRTERISTDYYRPPATPSAARPRAKQPVVRRVRPAASPAPAAPAAPPDERARA